MSSLSKISINDISQKESIVVYGKDNDNTKLLSNIIADNEKIPSIHYYLLPKLPNLNFLKTKRQELKNIEKNLKKNFKQTKRTSNAENDLKNILSEIHEVQDLIYNYDLAVFYRRIFPNLQNIFQLGFDGKIYESLQKNIDETTARIYESQFEFKLLQNLFNSLPCPFSIDMGDFFEKYPSKQNIINSYEKIKSSKNLTKIIDFNINPDSILSSFKNTEKFVELKDSKIVESEIHYSISNMKYHDFLDKFKNKFYQNTSQISQQYL